ncbi:MAG: RNA polymerase sigma factor [Planctomycetota bacterium JB042]
MNLVQTPADTRTEDDARARRWIEQYRRLIRSIARRTIHDAWDLEEVEQEIYIKLWKAMDRFDPALAKESTFVAVVAQRCIVDFHRRRARQMRHRPEPIEDAEELVTVDEDGAERSEQFDRASRALETLGADRERILGMSYLDGITHREIAKKTGLSLGTVKSHLRRGLLELKSRLHALPPCPSAA